MLLTSLSRYLCMEVLGLLLLFTDRP